MKKVCSQPIKNNFSLQDHKNKWWQVIFFHPAAWVALTLVVIHQSIVASSIFLLTEAIHQFQIGAIFAPLIYLYLLSMIAPYIPGTISFIYLQKWINQAHLCFVNSFLAKMNASTIFPNSLIKVSLLEVL